MIDVHTCISFSYYLSYYLVCSVFTFVFFTVDKQLAIKQSKRISERNLIFASILCGWPGGLVAMKMFRHKTKKTSFKAMMVLAVLLNLAVLSFLIFSANCLAK